LLFSKEDFFDAETLIFQLQGRPYLETLVFNAEHGFIDYFVPNFDKEWSGSIKVQSLNSPNYATVE